MKTPFKKYQIRRISNYLSYRIREICEIYKDYGLNRNIVNQWIENGLKPIDDKKPILIHGPALKDYLRDKKNFITHHHIN